jgi:hypothetical protein
VVGIRAIRKQAFPRHESGNGTTALTGCAEPKGQASESSSDLALRVRVGDGNRNRMTRLEDRWRAGWMTWKMPVPVSKARISVSIHDSPLITVACGTYVARAGSYSGRGG